MRADQFRRGQPRKDKIGVGELVDLDEMEQDERRDREPMSFPPENKRKQKSHEPKEDGQGETLNETIVG
jgi:hypothetical protein